VKKDTRTWKRHTATTWFASRAGLLAVASTWRDNTAPCHTFVRRGEWMTSKHYSLSRCSSPWWADYSLWWADYSLWRVVTDFCREVRFFTPKTQFSSTPISNLIGNSTRDDSTTWTSIMHIFYGLSTPLTTKFLPHDLIPKSTKQQQQPVKFSFRIT